MDDRDWAVSARSTFAGSPILWAIGGDAVGFFTLITHGDDDGRQFLRGDADQGREVAFGEELPRSAFSLSAVVRSSRRSTRIAWLPMRRYPAAAATPESVERCRHDRQSSGTWGLDGQRVALPYRPQEGAHRGCSGFDQAFDVDRSNAEPDAETGKGLAVLRRQSCNERRRNFRIQDPQRFLQPEQQSPHRGRMLRLGYGR